MKPESSNCRINEKQTVLFCIMLSSVFRTRVIGYQDLGSEYVILRRVMINYGKAH